MLYPKASKPACMHNYNPKLTTVFIHVNYWMHVSVTSQLALSIHENYPGCNLIP